MSEAMKQLAQEFVESLEETNLTQVIQNAFNGWMNTRADRQIEDIRRQVQVEKDEKRELLKRWDKQTRDLQSEIRTLQGRLAKYEGNTPSLFARLTARLRKDKSAIMHVD